MKLPEYLAWYRKRYLEVYICSLPGGKEFVSILREGTVNHNSADAYLLSFPKCGRTWLRLMLAKILVTHFELPVADLLDLEKIGRLSPDTPVIKVTHDDNPMWKTPRELLTKKREYTNKCVIFLVRDPRDVVVSLYFHNTRRIKRKYDKSLSAFIREERGSFKSIINFYNIWADRKVVPKRFLLVKYEDMKANPLLEIQKILNFLQIVDVPEQLIAKVIEYTSLENMKQMEREGIFEGSALKSHDKFDPESFKARRGKVGGFVDYLYPKDIDYLNELLYQLWPGYGYRVTR